MAFQLMAGNARLGRATGKQRRGPQKRVGYLENDPCFWGFWLPWGVLGSPSAPYEAQVLWSTRKN